MIAREKWKAPGAQRQPVERDALLPGIARVERREYRASHAG